MRILLVAIHLVLCCQLVSLDAASRKKVVDIVDRRNLFPAQGLPELTGLKVIKEFKTKRSRLAFVRTVQGETFVVKQPRGRTSPGALSVFRELTASYIACKVGVPINPVWVIPPGIRFPGKYYFHRLASLQRFLPGAAIREFAMFEGVALKQRISKDDQPEEHGLNRRVITSMGKHKDLPLIVAFDTFVGNPDRHTNNIFYHQDKNIFCGIDLELSFRSRLSKVACEQISCLKKKGKGHIAPFELRGLSSYCETFSRMVTQCHPGDISCFIRTLMDVVGAIPPIKDQEVDVEKYCAALNLWIYNEYENAKRLIDQLNKLIDEEKEVFKRSVVKARKIIRKPSRKVPCIRC